MLRMDRSRTPSAKTLAVGLLLAGSFMFCVLAASTSTTGCSSAETTPAPDAAKPPCNRGPFFFSCQTPAPGEPSCSTANGTSEYLKQLPQSTAYPVGCVINFVGARDEQGDCNLEAVCKCVIGEIPGTPITPSPEAGTTSDAGDAGDPGDAGGDAEAGTPPPLEDAGTTPPATGPVWVCE